MSKTTSLQKATNTEVDTYDPKHDPSKETISRLDFSQLKGLAELLPNTEDTGFNLVTEYLEFEKKGESLDCIFVGWDTFTVPGNDGEPGKDLQAVVVMDTNYQLWVNAGVHLTSSLRQARVQPGAFLTITYVESQKVAKGSMKKYRVTLRKVAEDA